MITSLWIPEPAADAAAANPNYIKTFTGLSTFFINSESEFSNGPGSPPRNPSDSWFSKILCYPINCF